MLKKTALIGLFCSNFHLGPLAKNIIRKYYVRRLFGKKLDLQDQVVAHYLAIRRNQDKILDLSRAHDPYHLSLYNNEYKKQMVRINMLNKLIKKMSIKLDINMVDIDKYLIKGE
jgi:hypothetical protein